jgi:hypothetical protein
METRRRNLMMRKEEKDQERKRSDPAPTQSPKAHSMKESIVIEVAL